MKTKTRENERRDSVIIIILILLLGFICIILASGWAIRFSPSWKLDTNMGSNLNPNSDFLTSRPVSFFEPLDPAILTKPAWMDVFLTPGASSVSFPTRTPLPTITATSVPPKTSTPVVPTSTPPAINTIIISSPTNTKATIPPPLPSTATPKPTATNTSLSPADLQITKTDGVVTYIPGNALSYTITVINNGPNSVTGAVVTDNIPPQISTWTWTCVQNGGAAGCNGVVGSNSNFSDTVSLPNGASIVYTVTANTSAVATGLLANIVAVNVPTGYTDPVPGNNSATDTDTILPPADLQITKTDGVITYIPGNALTYTITVTNNGSNGVIGAVVTDNIPTQITTWTWACAQNGGATGCNGIVGSTANFTNTVNLPNGASIVYTVTANTSVSATGSLTNAAIVSVPAGYTDPVPGNNSVSDTDTVLLPADLQITKTDGVITYTPGNALTYTVTVTNNGLNSVTGAVVTDNIPAQITTWDWVCTSQTGGATGCNGVAANNMNFTNTVNLPNGASIVYTVTAYISPAANGNLSNTASITMPVGYTDPTLANNTATDTDTPVFSSDLAIFSITDNSTDYDANATKTYIIVVSNAGPSNATGATVTVTEVFLTTTNIASINWTCAAAVGASCTANGSGNINDTVNIPAGSTVTYTLTANVIASPSGSLVYSATVSLPTDPNNSNNSKTDTDQLIVSSSFSSPPYVNIDPVKNNTIEFIPTNTTVTLKFGTPLIVGGHVGYDLVYYELPQGVGIWMDAVILQVGDGNNWYTILNWGDGIPDTNTSISLPLILSPPNPTTCAGEPDNCEIDVSFLISSSGVGIELDGVVPAGTYPYIRIISPPAPLDSGDGVEVDAITILP